MKLAVPDLISNSYFPAVAAVELGFFKQEGLDVELELVFPVDNAYRALRDGAVDFVGVLDRDGGGRTCLADHRLRIGDDLGWALVVCASGERGARLEVARAKDGEGGGKRRNDEASHSAE